MEDQAAIVTYLRKNRIYYRMEPVINAILIPKEQVHETRLALAKVGLPKDGSGGYEILVNERSGMSEFHQRIAFVRALEEELIKTIRLIDIVDHVRVNIIFPEQCLALERQTPSSTLVLLRLRSDFQMMPEQMRAIVHLVSESVQGLLPENVIVVDTFGNILSDTIY